MAYRTFRCFGLGLAALALTGMATAQKVQLLKSADYTLQVTELNAGLKSPWGMAFLPDGRLLVTQKSGSIAVLSRDGRRIEQTITGLPRVASQGQGGLLDVALDPDFARTPWVYWSYAEPGEGGLSGTAVARAK
ncbi:MAG: PQQ-dependent sugar dehydrogenase, partial [Arenimonas sp.]